MTIAQLLIIILLAAAWPFALSSFAQMLQAAVPPPPPGAPDAAYALALQILSFVSNNAEILAAASVLLTAVLVAWRGYD